MGRSSISRTYLRKRKLTGEVRTARTVEQTIADWHTLRIKTALGVTLRETTRVRLVRPWWMPSSLYRWLMRTIVVDRDGTVERSRSSSGTTAARLEDQ